MKNAKDRPVPACQMFAFACCLNLMILNVLFLDCWTEKTSNLKSSPWTRPNFDDIIDYRLVDSLRKKSAD